MDATIVDKFIDTWGSMGSLWGVNTSVAKVHGLLIATETPWCLDDIAQRLSMSKSNVSTSLKELRSWSVVRKTFIAGDRREFYVCEPDVWKMLFCIMRERKKREFDPIVNSIQETLESAKAAPDGIALDRLKQMEQMLQTFDTLAVKLLSGETQARAVISFFMGRT
jgi:HTH-type transcriptional regulator, glycine betaine synthesis regulator